MSSPSCTGCGIIYPRWTGEDRLGPCCKPYDTAEDYVRGEYGESLEDALHIIKRHLIFDGAPLRVENIEPLAMDIAGYFNGILKVDGTARGSYRRETDPVPTTPEEKWRRPWMTDEWVENWKSLDHTMCTQFVDAVPPLSIEEYYALPAYIKCRSMHCPDCGKRTGSQGHLNCPGREAKGDKE